nr:hypothetical protein [Tanacetum cinerariifolium]
MLLLLVQQKLTNLIIDERYNLNVALCMFTRCIVIQRLVEDLQLGVKSYQKKLNLTKPDTFRSDLRNKTPYTAYSDPQGVIYMDQLNKNRLMCTDELHKFINGTLNFVRTTLHDIALGGANGYVLAKLWKYQRPTLDSVEVLRLSNICAKLFRLIDAHMKGEQMVTCWLNCGSTKDRPFKLLYWRYKVVKFSTWMAFGGNTRDLGSFREETDEITDLHQIIEEILLTERGDDVTSIMRRHRDLSSDTIWNLETALGRDRLKEDLESST